MFIKKNKVMKKYKNFINENKQDNVELYHYTSLENAIKILESSELKVRSYSIINKYSYGMGSDDWGYVSFTEDDDFEDSQAIDVPKDIRFVFNKSDLERDFEITPFSFDNEQKASYMEPDADDLDYQNLDWFGNESEMRIYNNVPLTHLKCVQRIEGDDKELEITIKNMCVEKKIKYMDYKI